MLLMLAWEVESQLTECQPCLPEGQVALEIESDAELPIGPLHVFKGNVLRGAVVAAWNA